MGKTFWRQRYSAREIAEAKAREDIIRRWQRGEKLSRLIKDAGIKLTRAGWWLARQRYEREDFAGLLDKRGGRKSAITTDVQVWIKEALDGWENLGRRDLREMLKQRFGLKISLSHISRLIRRVGIRRKRGGQRKGYAIDREKGIPTDHAGVYFLKGADTDMEGAKTICEEIIKAREEEIPECSALKRIQGTTPATIKKKIETLLYRPMFDMQKPYHLLKYHKKGLGILTGSGKRYSYYTADIFLCDIEKLKIAQKVSESLTRCYIESLCIEIELEDGSYFYIDGHSKHVWSSKNIPKAFFTTLKRAERGLHQYFIHSSKGNPLILLTCPGDTHLPGAIFNLIDAFENAVGKKILKAAIFDREGLSLSIFEEFDRRKKYFITLLRDNMYKGEESFKLLSKFKPLKTEEKNGEVKVLEWVAEAEYELKNKENKRKRIVRAALVRKKINEKLKLIPIITNLTSKEEPNIAKVAKRYFDRWPNQENIFKDAIQSLKVDTNHGYKKQEVPNRVAERKKQELQTNLRGITQKLEKTKKDKEKTALTLNKLKGIYQNRKQNYQKEINELYIKIGLPISNIEERRKYLLRLKLLESRLRKLTKEYTENLSHWEVKLKNKEQHQKSLITQKENKEREIQNLNLEKTLYEINTEKDHLMSNLKTLLINLSSYAQRQYFPKEFQTFTMERMKKAFYQQDGYVKIKKRRVDVTLHSYDGSDLQKAVEYACMKFNNSNLKTMEGQRIWMWVEPSKCQVSNDN